MTCLDVSGKTPPKLKEQAHKKARYTADAFPGFTAWEAVVLSRFDSWSIETEPLLILIVILSSVSVYFTLYSMASTA